MPGKRMGLIGATVLAVGLALLPGCKKSTKPQRMDAAKQSRAIPVTKHSAGRQTPKYIPPQLIFKGERQLVKVGDTIFEARLFGPLFAPEIHCVSVSKIDAKGIELVFQMKEFGEPYPPKKMRLEYGRKKSLGKFALGLNTIARKDKPGTAMVILSPTQLTELKNTDIIGYSFSEKTAGEGDYILGGKSEPFSLRIERIDAKGIFVREVANYSKDMPVEGDLLFIGYGKQKFSGEFFKTIAILARKDSPHTARIRLITAEF
jgi:hypothetical protein